MAWARRANSCTPVATTAERRSAACENDDRRASPAIGFAGLGFYIFAAVDTGWPRAVATSKPMSGETPARHSTRTGRRRYMSRRMANSLTLDGARLSRCICAAALLVMAATAPAAAQQAPSGVTPSVAAAPAAGTTHDATRCWPFAASCRQSVRQGGARAGRPAAARRGGDAARSRPERTGRPRRAWRQSSARSPQQAWHTRYARHTGRAGGPADAAHQRARSAVPVDAGRQAQTTCASHSPSASDRSESRRVKCAQRDQAWSRLDSADHDDGALDPALASMPRQP